SMLIDPGRHLLRTARRHKLRTAMVVRSPSTVGCAQNPCCLSGLPALIKKGRCPNAACTLTADDLLPDRVNQKLVDTMLTADLLFLNREGEPSVVLASSDDDFVPPILQALAMGTRVYHLHLQPQVH